VAAEAYWFWMLADACVGLAGICVGIIGDRTAGWHGWVVWAISIAMLVLHTARWELRILPSEPYYASLDGLFLAWIATLILAGGGGVGRFLRDRLFAVSWVVRSAGQAPGR